MALPFEWLDRPTLTDPVMVVMLNGWIDASNAASAAMSALDTELTAHLVGRFDRDTFIDYRARRPTMEVRSGLNSRLAWADIELKAGRDRNGRDVVLLSGHEPDMAWQLFCSTATDLARQLGVTTAIGIGAYPIAVPHTRPTRLSCTAPDPTVLASLPYLKNSVDVPAGMEAVLEHSLTDAGVTAFAIWAQVPHYISQMSYPAASLALLEGLRDRTGLDIDTSATRAEAVLQRTRLDELVASNNEHSAMVRQLEQLLDAADAAPPPLAASERSSEDSPIDPASLPSADELAAELEQFLRDQG